MMGFSNTQLVYFGFKVRSILLSQYTLSEKSMDNS